MFIPHLRCQADGYKSQQRCPPVSPICHRKDRRDGSGQGARARSRNPSGRRTDEGRHPTPEEKKDNCVPTRINDAGACDSSLRRRPPPPSPRVPPRTCRDRAGLLPPGVRSDQSLLTGGKGAHLLLAASKARKSRGTAAPVYFRLDGFPRFEL